ncbi:MAG: DJ-1/PfpI family protein, partial [Anaerolineaceae bacterium]
VAILVFDDVEILDFAGPYEVFNDASELSKPVAFTVYNVGISNSPVIGRGKFTVTPRYSIDNCPQADILVIPGGFGTRPLLKHDKLITWIADQSRKVELLMSVCTGALLLAQAGLLRNCPATTHHGAFEELRTISPSTRVIEDKRFVQSSERIFTSGGISAGIDLSLFVVEKLTHADLRADVIEEMEYQGYDDNLYSQ